MSEKQAREGLVEKDEAAVASELGDAGRQPVEHVALGADEAGQVGPGLLAIFDIDRIAGNSGLAERHLDDPHHPALAGDRRRHGARLRLALLVDRDRLQRRVAVVDQLDTAFDHGRGALRLDRLDIGAVHHCEAQVGTAMPHRERRRLDQAGQCVEGRGEAPDLVAKRRRLAFAVGRVGEPEQDRPLLERRRRRRSAHLQHARRAQRPHRHGKAAAGRGGALGKLGKRRPLLGREAASAAAQIGDAGRRSIETEQAGKAAVGLQPAAAAEQGRDGDMGAEQRRRPLGVADPGGRPPAESDAAQGRPGGDGQPRAANQRDQRHDGGGEGQHRHLLGRVRGQRKCPGAIRQRAAIVRLSN